MVFHKLELPEPYILGITFYKFTAQKEKRNLDFVGTANELRTDENLRF